MAASDNLNSAVAALQTAGASVTSAVDAYVAAVASAPVQGTPDSVVQAAADAIFNVAASLSTESAKLKLPLGS